MEALVILLIPLPLILLVALALLINKFRTESVLDKRHQLIGQYGEVIYSVDKRDGAIIMGNTIVFCRSYGSKIKEGESVLITEYDFVAKTYRVERAPRKIYRVQQVQ